MAGNGEEKMKAIADLIANLLRTINEVDKTEGEDVTPNTSPRQNSSPPPQGSITTSHGKGASTSTTEEDRQNSLRTGEARPKSEVAAEEEVRPEHQKVKCPLRIPPGAGHKTEDCISLRQEVMNMLHQEHLKELMSDRGRANFARGREQHQGPPKPPSLARTIQMIIRGGDDASINSMKFTTTHILKRSITHNVSSEGQDVIRDPEIIEATGSTIEDVDPVRLDDNDHSKKAFIGHKHQEPDMPGIPKETATHKLNVDPFQPPVRQIKQKFNAAINDAVGEKVEKLLENGSIRESKYPQWVSNMVMVKKKSGKWRMCMDFTELNKACLKDSFLLPHIDQLIDVTAGHKLLSFLDAYSGYNQILMEEEYQKKTTFITHQGTYCYRVMPFGQKNAGRRTRGW
ncbi:PREDICTED: uncharacterized protein LOC109206978 [Nicotiana attenuata]|uniref:uncharacterized protein LOC109206978 n=1 Tax=Nicotiana attenuata TaxID=49451 RepID=UPI000904DC94|nr:PREDICTED: uncharacterized protein LOC109206978 [Nicotiana attenuata]